MNANREMPRWRKYIYECVSGCFQKQLKNEGPGAMVQFINGLKIWIPYWEMAKPQKAGPGWRKQVAVGHIHILPTPSCIPFLCFLVTIRNTRATTCSGFHDVLLKRRGANDYVLDLLKWNQMKSSCTVWQRSCTL